MIETQSDSSRRMRGNRNNATWFMKIHRRLIKPPHPTLLHCPNCGGPLLEINADMVEIDNYAGVQYQNLAAKDVWMRLKHYKCGAKITMYWKD